MAKLKTMTVKGEDGVETTVGVLDSAGNPIYEIDGKEVGQDLVILRSDLTRANGEAAARRVELKELKEKYAPFEGLDLDKAKAALEIVANLDDKKLLDAKQVDVMKAQWEESFKANKAQTDAAYETKITELTEALNGKDASIKRMLVKGVFDTSKYLENTVYGPLRDAAYEYFGKHFEVEPGENGDFNVIAKLNGNPILSTARPGQLATPDEALEEIIKAHPQKDHILKGSQASGGGATDSGGGGSKTTLGQLEEKLAVAQKNRNATEVRLLTDQIFTLKQQAAG